jgi:hypothetical protein
VRKIISPIIFMVALMSTGFCQTITVKFGIPNMYLPINSIVDIPVSIETSSPDVWIQDMCLPMATNNMFFTDRFNNGEFFYPLSDWDIIEFRSPYPFPTGCTSQSIIGFARVASYDAPYLNPYPGGRYATFRVRTVNDTSLIGVPIPGIALFQEGIDSLQGGINFGDTLGRPGYPNIVVETYGATFVEPWICVPESAYLGTGTGVMGDTKDSIVTFCENGEFYRLMDIARRPTCNIYGFDGQMNDTSEIKTRMHNSDIQIDYDNVWTEYHMDRCVDAHVYAGWYYDIVLHNLNRNGFDGNGISMVSTTDDTRINNNARFYADSVFYGTVSTGRYSFAGCIDVVAHEWSHGLTAHASRLRVAAAECYALNESFSDMMGSYLTFARNPQAPDTIIWRIGENHYGGTTAARSMSNPEIFQHPHTYQGQYWYSGSNPGTYGHTNCGVPNKMFYLLSAGGTHNNVIVDGIGIQNAIKVLYQANLRHWDSLTTFQGAMKGSLQAAVLDLHRPDWAIQTNKAWQAVKVRCSYEPGDPDGDGFCLGADSDYLMSWFQGLIGHGGQHMECLCEDGELFQPAFDFNGDCVINWADMHYAVDFYRGIHAQPLYCPDFPPSP